MTKRGFPFTTQILFRRCVVYSPVDIYSIPKSRLSPSIQRVIGQLGDWGSVDLANFASLHPQNLDRNSKEKHERTRPGSILYSTISFAARHLHRLSMFLGYRHGQLKARGTSLKDANGLVGVQVRSTAYVRLQPCRLSASIPSLHTYKPRQSEMKVHPIFAWNLTCCN
jgi:hypothetical protein